MRSILNEREFRGLVHLTGLRIAQGNSYRAVDDGPRQLRFN